MAPSILLLAGPAAAGKTTTARALAAGEPRGLHVPVDDLRSMVVGGREDPGPDWSEALRVQLRLARSTAIAMANAYAAEGFAVVIDDFFDPLGMREYRDLLGSGAARAVLLLPSAEVARARNASRAGGPDPTADRAIEHAWGFLPPRLERLRADGWLVLDSSSLDVPATVDVLARFWRDGG